MDSDDLTKRIEQLEAKVAQLMTDSTPKTEKPKDDGKVFMTLYKKSVLVSGSTFGIKNTLSENGGKWNRSLGGWIFTKSHLDEVIQAIREHEEIELTVSEDVVGEGVGEGVERK